MKFRSEQGILAEALGALARIASTRNAGTPALSGVKMSLEGDTLVASSTDTDISLQFTLPVGGDTDGEDRRMGVPRAGVIRGAGIRRLSVSDGRQVDGARCNALPESKYCLLSRSHFTR